MRRIRKKKDMHLDIAPINLIDLLLVILVFFITTTSFLQLKVINLSLPQADTSDVKYSKNHTHVVNITPACAFYLDTKEMKDIQMLKTSLVDIVNKDAKAIFQIGADKESKHHCFIKVLDSFNSLGITDISILTKLDS